MPTDVAVLSDGSFCVSDGYRNSRVARFDAQGKFLTSWGSKGTGPGQLQLPHGIAADAHDRLYVCDRSNSRIQLFDSKGSFLAQWSGPHIGRPYGISVSPTGTLFAIDGGDPALPAAQRGKVVELDAEGRLLDSFGAPGSGPGQFQTGHDIAVGPDSSVYVAEGAGARVQSSCHCTDSARHSASPSSLRTHGGASSQKIQSPYRHATAPLRLRVRRVPPLPILSAPPDGDPQTPRLPPKPSSNRNRRRTKRRARFQKLRRR